MHRVLKSFGVALLACMLCGAQARASDLEDVVDVAGDIVELIREVRGLRGLYERERDDRYERDLVASEGRLEEARVREVARLAGVRRDVVRGMRDRGQGWGEICRDYGISLKRLGYGPGGRDSADGDDD